MFRLHNVPMLVSLRRDFVGRPMLTIIFDSQIKRRHPTLFTGLTLLLSLKVRHSVVVNALYGAP